MKKELEDKLDAMGVDDILDQLEALGAGFEEINVGGKEELMLRYDCDEYDLNAYLCKEDSAEKIIDFLKFHLLRMQDNDDIIIEEIKKVQSVIQFDEIINKYTPGQKTDKTTYFCSYWKLIPNKKAFYDIYKDCLTGNEDKWCYNQLMKADLINEVRKYNSVDVAENKELLDLVDNDGYITIYHGHSKPTLRGSYSWTIKKDIAKWFGNRNALFSGADKFYVATGKVLLKDIITYVTDRQEFEVVVCPKDVKEKTKEYFDRNKKDVENN